MVLAPSINRCGSAADVDREDRGRILIEDHAVAADAEPEAAPAMKGFDVKFC
jgi:hypothetical protein